VVLVFYCYVIKVLYNQYVQKEGGLAFFANPPLKGQWFRLSCSGESVLITEIDHYRMQISVTPILAASDHQQMLLSEAPLIKTQS
jgi:hypothetical protein